MTTPKPFREDPTAASMLRKFQEKSGFVSGAEMGRAVKLSRKSVWRHLARLRSIGCSLEGNSTQGYRLVDLPDCLRPEVVASGLPVSVWGHPYHGYESVGSTNDICHDLAHLGQPEGTVVAAETQLKGRGRMGRAWHLPKGKGLAFSLLLRPKLPPTRLPLLTLASALGVARALEDEGARPGIKWPNDVELDGRKVCGILTEAQAELDRLQYAVVGIGLNVNVARADFPLELRDRAIGLSEALGHPVDRVAFFRRLLRRLQEAHGNLFSGRADRLLHEWRIRATVLGRQVKIHQGGRVLFGQALDVDEQGALLVRNDWGFTETVTTGDVETLRLAPPGRTRRSVRRRSSRL